MAATLIAASVAPAQVTAFDVAGVLQAATLGGPGVGAHQGGTLAVNGVTVIVPAETIVTLPANQLTWQELFAQAPAPYGPSQTGLASADAPTPLNSYNVHVVGNIVGGISIAGLVDISTTSSGQGIINFIDFATGEMRVGGIPGSSTTGTRVQLNDAVGRFGRFVSPDPRLTSDADNPTIRSVTGFPMCVQRTLALVVDPLCPQANRPRVGPGPFDFANEFFMSNPVTSPGVPPDPTQQAPFEIGDFVTYAGTLVQDGVSQYISAHTIIDSVVIFTAPGTNPAYAAVDVKRLDVAAPVCVPTSNHFEGFSTDPTRGIHLFGIDLNPADGSTTDRDWGSVGVGADGHWVFNPAQGLGTLPPPGTLLPPTREVRAVIPGAFFGGQSPTFANGIFAGQYQATLEDVFRAPAAGGPPFAFETFPFLACGGFTSSAGTLTGQLNPWPGTVAPPYTPGAPTVSTICPNAGPSQGGTVVTINGTNLSTAPGATTVNFGANAATNVSCANSNPGPDGILGTADDVPPILCVATSPPGSGIVDVIVSVNGLKSAPTAADRFTYVADTAPPLVSCGSPDGLWHAMDVSIACTASDSGSGLANAADASFFLSTSVPVGTENANASTGMHQVCDNAGNCATAGPIPGNMVDRKAPSILITSPTSITYTLNQSIPASYSCADGGSGTASCVGPVASGTSFKASPVGPASFTVNATDNVGNPSSASVGYTVGYAAGGPCFGDAGHQILQPINADGSSVFKQGSTVPVKFRVCDATGASQGTAGVVSSFRLVQKTAGTVSSTVNEAAISTSADTAFRFDTTAQQWIFNLSTKSLSASVTYVYQITLNDGSAINFHFGLK